MPQMTGDPIEDKPGFVRGGLIGYLRRTLANFTGLQPLSNTDQFDDTLGREEVSSGPQGLILPWYPPYNSYTENQSESSPEMQMAYRRMMSDPNVHAAVTTQIFGVGALNLQIRPPKNPTKRDIEITEWNSWTFTQAMREGLHNNIWQILSGMLLDGYSLCSKVLAVETAGEWTGKIRIASLKAEDVGFNVVLRVDEHRNVVNAMGLRYNAGQYFDMTRFVYARHMPLYNSPVGQSALRAAYRAWWSLRVAQQLRLVFLEKRAIPIIWGNYKTASQKQSLDRALGLAKSKTWITVPDDVRLEVLNAAGGAEEAYAAAVKDWKHDIFLGIQAASLPNIEGQVSDGRGNTEIQMSQADLFKSWLSQTITNIFNDHESGLIKDNTDLNYVTDRYPTASLSAINQEEIKEELNNYYTAWEMGVDLSKQEIYDKFNWKRPTDPDDTLKGKAQDAMISGSAGSDPNPPAPPGSKSPFDETGFTDESESLNSSSDSGRSQEVPSSDTFQFSESWKRYFDSRSGKR
jgi:hypothetical protein